MSLEKKIMSWLFGNPISRLRGWFGEKKVGFRLWLTLDNKIYHRYHDLIIPAKFGTSQLDHLLVSEYGIFIIETKNKKGWIFGSGGQAEWTQVIYGKKYTFQNPLRQAYSQKKSLAKFLKIPETRIHTIAYFSGHCKFKTKMPPNVLRRGVRSYIRSFREPIFSNTEVNEILANLNKHFAESTLTAKAHVKSLKQRHSSKTICPRCGAKLVKRIGPRRFLFRTRFLGCERFPRCRFTRKL